MKYDVHMTDGWTAAGGSAWAREATLIYVVRRAGPGEPREYLRRDGTWAKITEGAASDPGEVGIELPDEVLDEIVRQRLQVRPVNQAVEEHLQDAVKVRDRLLSLVEKGAS